MKDALHYDNSKDVLFRKRRADSVRNSRSPRRFDRQPILAELSIFREGEKNGSVNNAVIYQGDAGVWLVVAAARRLLRVGHGLAAAAAPGADVEARLLPRAAVT